MMEELVPYMPLYHLQFLYVSKRIEDDVNSSRCAFPKFVRILYICSVLLECTFNVQKLAGPAAKFTTPLTLCDPVKV